MFNTTAIIGDAENKQTNIVNWKETNWNSQATVGWPGEGVHPYLGYIGMCWKTWIWDLPNTNPSSGMEDYWTWDLHIQI